MENKDLEKFDPSVAELTKMVQATKGITATDLKDKKQLAVVRENRIALKNARVKITKIGKELREDAIAFQRAVIDKEKSLIAIIEPEEERLAAIEEEAEQLAIREERLEKLPIRKERLLAINGTKWATDEELLVLDSEGFESFYNICVAENNEALRLKAIEEQNEREEKARLAREKEEAKIKEEQDKKQAEIDAREAEIKAREDAVKAEEQRIEREREIKEAEERAREQAIKDEKERIEREAEKKAQEEKEKQELLAKRKKYQDFLAKHGWTTKTKDDFKVEETAEGYVLYKKLGVFKK